MKIELVIRHEPAPMCPPHEFQVAWAVPGETTNGVALCAACGDVQSLDMREIGAPAEETLRAERE